MSEKVGLSAAGHEPNDVGGNFIWAGAMLVLGMAVALALLVLWLFPTAITDRTLHLPLPLYPDPQLQPSAREDMAKFHSQEMQSLNSTGWVDKARGIVHIPIADAMRKVAKEGIPGWPPPPEARP
jgi:hypothetical protein